jgi:hypothetical protein
MPPPTNPQKTPDSSTPQQPSAPQRLAAEVTERIAWITGRLLALNWLKRSRDPVSKRNPKDAKEN